MFGARDPVSQRAVSDRRYVPGTFIALSQALSFIRERRLPAMIDLWMDPEMSTPYATLSAIRATARLQR